MKAQILSVQWPNYINLAEPSNFETQARNRRYQLLAQSAQAAEIKHLFVGHHLDDQIETTLMRTIRSGPSLLSFRGIAQLSRIPVQEGDLRTLCGSSQLQELVPWSVEAQNMRLASEGSIEKLRGEPTHDLRINTCGGRISVANGLDMKLCRPLLGFPKSRILSTCEENSIPFVTDPTNMDARLTLRNAIRFLRANHNLPHALSDTSLLHMHQISARRSVSAKRRSQRHMQTAQVTRIDLRSGAITVRIPRGSNAISSNNRKSLDIFLGSLLELVRPARADSQNTTGTEDVEDILQKMTEASMSPRPDAKPERFSLAKVLLTRVDQRSLVAQNASHITWRLSRQPFSRHEQEAALTKSFVCQQTSSPGTNTEQMWSDWVFWDKRYWFRIHCNQLVYLQNCIVRPYREADVQNLYHQLSWKHRELGTKLRAIMNDAAPGDDRWSLPVIVDAVGLRAFPTLGIRLPQTAGEVEADTAGLICWEVRYKYMDPEILKQFTAPRGSGTHLRMV